MTEELKQIKKQITVSDEENNKLDKLRKDLGIIKLGIEQ